jgi:hypothetical protein
MKPPKSRAGEAATAAGILALGAGAGAIVGYAYMPAGKIGSVPAKAIGTATGALLGGVATSIGALGLSEFVESDWADVERWVFMLGGGGAALFLGYGLVQELQLAKSLEASAGSPALPPTTSPSGVTNFDVGLSDSGRTLVVGAGDTVTIALPSPTSPQWSIAAPAGLVTLKGSPTLSNDVQTFVLVAQSGSGQVVATPASGGGAFTLNLNIV